MDKTESTSMIKRKKIFIFDLDGTIYLDGVLFPGAAALFEQLHKMDKDYVFLTNNSSLSSMAYLHKIQGLGIPCSMKNVATSTQAAIAYLKQHHVNDLIYVMGTKSMIEELKEASINVANTYFEGIDGVLIGYDIENSYQKLIDVSRLLTEGKFYLATNPDLVCPVSFGFVPDCGSFALMLENATHRKPHFLGKPQAEIIEMIIDRFEVSKEEVILIGDRLYTDIKCGINANIDTVLVLSGETTLKDLDASEVKPTLVVKDVNEILELLVG